jgi:hypothetical protein
MTIEARAMAGDDRDDARTAREDATEDAAIIAALRSSGIDTNVPRDIAHNLWFPDDTSCRRAAELVRKDGRAVVVGPLGDGSGCPLTVLAWHELTPDTVGRLRAEFEAVAVGLSGSYQGWAVAGRSP